ncbi:hypothetical protein [Ruminococcus albus]|uniref:Uncharacterized protein n=1 Tax=Ruminococcus albus (strain ATCC 27210 / DSM 20455 / JCM 14654 / NCDO 2250 / 7) TaxID=697329 RepID=E6UE10_RUMA7|nr:hypothetical protein [Ruminococcus albus]ADU22875.1 hypothetical protein Rumal_2395 [Ruminococcus albus 7 = DSM 20455]
MKTKFTSQRKGAVLMTVTVVSVMMMVIIAAATSLVNHTNVRTNIEYRKKQAYYVASSCLRAFVAETTGYTDSTYTSAEIQAKLDLIRHIADENRFVNVEIDKMDKGSPTPISKVEPRWSNAKCQLKVERINDNSVKVISTATYLGQEKTAVAYLSAQTMRKSQYTPKALEIIGTDGGNPSKGYFENIVVYGSTGATDKDSHDNNTLYKFDNNQNELYGDVDINGSLVIQNHNYFKSNPYYCQGEDDSKGCVLNVTRSLIISNNEPEFSPDFEKTASDNNDARVSPYNYNYVNVGEALVYTANNGGCFGKDDTHQVDIYTNLLYIGKADDMQTGMMNAIKGSNTDPDFNKKAYQFGSGNGAGFKVYGNVYTFKDLTNGTDSFNGDVVVNTTMDINGELYVGGDLYITHSTGNINCKKIHMQKGNYIFENQDRFVDASGKPTRSGTGTQPATVCGISVTYDDDWTGEIRAQRPEFPTINDNTNPPYYYFPEHLLCEPGYSETVSTIYNQYRDMYKADRKTLDIDNVKNATSFGTDGTVYTSNTGTGSFKPDHIVTDDCYIDYLENTNILIDLDQLPAGKKNLVVILKDGGKTVNENVILVKNSTNPESDDAKFCYFVSDSGFGDTKDDYAMSGHDKNTISTYDHSSFNKNPKFTFGGSKNLVMDFDTFCNVDCMGRNGATSGDKAANTTKNQINNGFDMAPNNIIFLFTEGSELIVDQATTLIQASMYMPRATYTNTNQGGQCKVAINNSTSRMQCLNIIGNIVCKHYNTKTGNNNAIVYNQLSSKSMLAYVKGSGEEKAEKSFMLDYYDNH